MTEQTLRQWKPDRQGRIWTTDKDAVARATPTTIAATEKAAGSVLLVDLGEEVARCDEMALLRAATLNGHAEQLYEPNRQCEGQPWYERLERIVDMEIEVRAGNDRLQLVPDRLADCGRSRRVDRVVVKPTLAHQGVERQVEWASDLAIECELVKMPESAGALLARESTVTIEELIDLLQDAHYAACRLLLAETDAQREVVRYAVEHRIAHLLPKDRSVQIRREADSERIDVRIGDPTPYTERAAGKGRHGWD